MLEPAGLAAMSKKGLLEWAFEQDIKPVSLGLATNSFSILAGFFELAQRPSGALNLASCIASGTSEIPGHCQVCRARGAFN